MSWLFKSLNSNHPECPKLHQSSLPGDCHGGVTVEDDISVIGQTLSRHLLGVANFLAPPPSSAAVADAAAGSSDSVSPSSPSSQTFTGIRNDLVEIGGTFRSSISRLSSNKAVSGISKLASQWLQFEYEAEVHGEENRSDGVPGITDEAVRFVKQISIQPECWTEFPLPLDNVDFSLSNAQREHALTMERLVPEFVELRQNLCSYMNVEKFWMIYFLLLLPRLNQHDFELLSTPKMVETRHRLLQKLSDKGNLQVEDCESPRTIETYQEGEEVSATERVTNPSERNQIVTEITNAAKELEIDDKAGFEQWFEDTDIESSSMTARTKLHEENVSDLEDYGSDLSDRLSGHRGAQDNRGSSPDGSNDWVQLKGSSDRGGSRRKAANLKGKDSEDESSDWLTVDEFN